MSELTSQERDVARLVAEGWSQKQVGAKLTPPISQPRVAVLVLRIASKWRLDRSRSLAVQIAERLRTERDTAA